MTRLRETPVDVTGRRVRSRAGVSLTVVGLLVAVGLVALGLVGVLEPRHSGALEDLAGHPVAFDAGTLPSPRQKQEMHATVAAPGDHLIVSSVGLDVPLGALNVVAGAIEPPTFTSAYWIRNLGTAPSASGSGTVFIAMHSLRGGGVGPGNYLYDTATGKPRVEAGQSVTVDGIGYTITGTSTVAKPDIGSDAGVWANTPNRLVMITCLELPSGGPSLDNFIVTATRAP